MVPILKLALPLICNDTNFCFFNNSAYGTDYSFECFKKKLCLLGNFFENLSRYNYILLFSKFYRILSL